MQFVASSQPSPFPFSILSSVPLVACQSALGVRMRVIVLQEVVGRLLWYFSEGGQAN